MRATRRIKIRKTRRLTAAEMRTLRRQHRQWQRTVRAVYLAIRKTTQLTAADYTLRVRP